jgi:hypothetical protein
VIRPTWLNACGKLPSSSPGRGVDLLGDQAQVVGVGGEPLEEPLGAFHLP